MIHIYCGDGKGKTTAACGLAVRASGSGMKVLFAQFFKSGASSEIIAMSKLDNIDTFISDRHYGRYKTLSDNEKSDMKLSYEHLLSEIISFSGKYDMIILDEAISAFNYAILGRDSLLDFLIKDGSNREIVLTGRNPSEELIKIADYITEMRKLRHPYDVGITARKGIEF